MSGWRSHPLHKILGRSKKQTETAADIDEDGNSIATQREVCLKKSQGLNADVVEEFSEPGVSAKNIEDRPAFKKLLEYLEYHKEVDYVLVYARSRAFRNLEDAVITERHFKRIGVRLVSARDDFGESIQGNAMKSITDTINQMQNELSGEDIRIKLEHKARNGGTVRKAPVGYLNIRMDIGGRMVNTVGLDEQRAPLIRTAFELYATGKYSIERLEASMADLGLTARPTISLPERPLSPVTSTRL
ncbi:recombinase family protein [Paenarthrobacter sp. NPDC091669]|uniref:recombinase family protein n=1 Tax=Paenarthrobacter sp. NPDC091669 TaxID=3364384 RepID=UPI0037F4729E